MAQNLDFGGDEHLDRHPKSPAQPIIRLTQGGSTTSYHVVSGSSVRFGRNSDQDVCLRVQPTSEPENARKTGLISGQHFILRHENDAILIEDQGSTNGTRVAETALAKSARSQLKSNTHISVGDVLELAFELFRSADNPSMIDCCLISRLDNLPNEKYLWLIKQAKISTAFDAVIRIEANDVASRGLDFGGSATATPGSLFLIFQEHQLAVKCMGQNVTVNGEPLGVRETRLVKTSDEIQFLDSLLNFEIRRQPLGA